MSVSWDPPTKRFRASERGETAIQRDRPSSFSGCRGKPINPTSQLLHYLACHSFPSLRPPQHTSYSLLPQTAPPKSLIRPLEQPPPSPATKHRLPQQLLRNQLPTSLLGQPAIPPRRRHCALSVPLDRRRDYTVFASTALCRPEPEQTHCDGPVRGHEVNGRWPLLYPFFCPFGRRQTRPILSRHHHHHHHSRGPVSISSSYPSPLPASAVEPRPRPASFEESCPVS